MVHPVLWVPELHLVLGAPCSLVVPQNHLLLVALTDPAGLENQHLHPPVTMETTNRLKKTASRQVKLLKTTCCLCVSQRYLGAGHPRGPRWPRTALNTKTWHTWSSWKALDS